MARLVIPASSTNGHLAAATASDRPADNYSDRLVKYLPAESVAFYAGIDKLVASHFGIDSTVASTTPAPAGALLWAALFFVIGLVGTPIYLYRRRLPNQPWVMNVVIATVAFPLWAYTLGGSLFVIIGWYSVFVAGLLAPIFTFVAGWFEPAAK
jgi:hypothetical protein